MIQVKNVFQEHKEEIDLFFCFLEEVINHDARLLIDPPTYTVRTIKVDTTAIIKSSFFLMLYNCVESTVTNCLNTIINTIEAEGCRYPSLQDELQVATLAAYDYQLRECESKDKRNEILKRQTDFVTGLSTIHIDIKSLVGSSSQGSFSGSLDAREIRKLFDRVGIDLSDLQCDEMKTIKECRNKLAHGEYSFQEYGRNLSIQYLQISKDNTLTFLEELINKVDNYLNAKLYKR